MSNMIKHAEQEFKAAGWVDNAGNFKDEMQEMMCKGVLDLLEVFAAQGHSGFSAPYAISLFTKLAKFKPITPLTGEDSEWEEISDSNDTVKYQNKRASNVFKGLNGAYDVDGKVFWEWQQRPLDEDEPGYPGLHTYKSHYTCRDSRVPVTFPYTVPEEPIYEWRYTPDCDPPSPPQTESGIIEN